MCGVKHTMRIAQDETCVRKCVRLDPKKWEYVLLVGDAMYSISDRGRPAPVLTWLGGY